MELYLSVYLSFINLYGFLVMGLDKKRAKKGSWRISEAHLIGTAVIGGSLGVYLGMRYFHHKTKHNQFKLGVPTIILIQALAFFYCLRLLS